MEVSIIVPIYNVEKYLLKCLVSISKQKFSDFEVILVDDGSTDNSKEICKKFAEKDSRFNYFYKNNGGLSDARNYGLRRAKGKYIIFIDSDDFVEKDYVSVLYEGIKTSNSEICICSFNEVDTKGRKIKEVKVGEKNIVSGKELIKKHFTNAFNVANIVAWNKIYRHDVFKEVHYISGKYFEDEFIFVPLFWNLKKISFVSNAEYNYVQREGSITKSKFTEKKLNDNLEFREERINFFNNKDKKLYEILIQDYKNYIISLIKDNTKFLSAQSIKKLQEKYNILVKSSNAKGLKNRVKDFIGNKNLKFFNIRYYGKR